MTDCTFFKGGLPKSAMQPLTTPAARERRSGGILL